MANTAQTNIKKLLDIALAEVGYVEKKNGNYNALYEKTKNAGTANYTKYGYEMNQIYPATMDYPAPWCDCFCDWCMYKAFGVSTAKSLLYGGFDDYTVASAQMYKNKKAWYTTNPQVGDQIFFKNASGGICHTGFVYAVNGTTVFTVEGNTSGAEGVVANGGCVAKKSYPLNSSRIAGYGRPNYAEARSAAKHDVSPKKNTKVAPAHTFDAAIAGTYQVTASQLRLRLAPGNGTVIMLMPNGTKVRNYGYYTLIGKTKWFLIQTGGVTGFCSSDYLIKI